MTEQAPKLIPQTAPSRHQGQILHPHNCLGRNFHGRPWLFFLSYPTSNSFADLVDPTFNIHPKSCHFSPFLPLPRWYSAQPSFAWTMAVAFQRVSLLLILAPLFPASSQSNLLKILRQVPLLPSPKPPQRFLSFLRIKSKPLTLMSRPYIICIPLTSSPTTLPC